MPNVHLVEATRFSAGSDQLLKGTTMKPPSHFRKQTPVTVPQLTPLPTFFSVTHRHPPFLLCNSYKSSMPAFLLRHPCSPMTPEYLPTAVMVVLQAGFAGLNIFSKLAMDSGMNPLVLVAYRQIFAALSMAPFAYFWERETRKKITKFVLFQLLLSSIFGATINQCLYFLGLKYTNPTIGCALTNLLPALTFIIAIPFRMENVTFGEIEGQAKVLGTILCVGGAMLMTFYKGKLIPMWQSQIHWNYAKNMTNDISSDDENRVVGSLLVVVSCIGWAVWFVIQGRMSKSFSSPYSSSTIMSSMASVQCLLIGACVERDYHAWALGWNIRLVAALYSGIIISGISFSLMTWCIQQRGPLFVSMFSPLLLVIVAIFGWAILGDKLHVGSVTGSSLIVGGLYIVLWGKGKELQEIESVGMGVKECQVQSTGLLTTNREFHGEENTKELDKKPHTFFDQSKDFSILNMTK